MPARTAKRLIIAAALMAVAFLPACNNDDKNEPESEVFRGVYFVRDLTIVEDARQIDSVLMTVTNNRNYAMFFWDAAGFDVDFCNCEGTVYDFGSNVAVFDLSFVHSNNCDSLRVPSGEYVADFVTHGDTVYFEQLYGDTLHMLLLLQE